MKFTSSKWSIASTLLAALALPLGVAAQNNATRNQKPKHHHYKLIDVGTFGGPNSSLSGPGVISLTNGGTFVGVADTTSESRITKQLAPVNESGPCVGHVNQCKQNTYSRDPQMTCF